MNIKFSNSCIIVMTKTAGKKKAASLKHVYETKFVEVTIFIQCVDREEP